MANQITCCMHYFTDPRQSQLGHLIKRHPGCVLRNNKVISRFSPGERRAAAMMDALWRKMIKDQVKQCIKERDALMEGHG